MGDAWHKTANGEFLAFDAAMVSKAPLFRTGDFGILAKFSPPLVANGRVWVAVWGAAGAGVSGKINVYGLK